MKMRYCKNSGCHKLISVDEKYCDEHKPQEELKERIELAKEERLKKISKGYKISSSRYSRYSHSDRSELLGHAFYQTSKWKRLSARVRKRDLYTCQVTGRIQLPHESFVVDHIVPRLVDESRAMDESNLWLISRQVHQKKTAIEDKLTPEQLKRMTKDDWIELLKD